MKQLGVAAVMMLCAVGASASNFRAADQVYLPVAGNLIGGGGAVRFVSDVFIANLTADDVSVSVVSVPFGASPGLGTDFNNVIQLAPYERKQYLNFYQSALGQSSGFGQLIFNGCKAGTSCGPETQNQQGVSPNFRNISVQSRIYSVPNPTPANPPTTGQLFSGIPWYHFVSSLQSSNGLDKVFITGITNNGTVGQAGTFRSNVGLVNASQYSRTTMVVNLYQGRLNAADLKGTYQVDLEPLGNVQPSFAAMFPNAAPGSNYFVTVEQRNNVPVGNVPADCVQGCPAFLAYGSVLDNVTGDATTLEAQYLHALSDEALIEIYPSGSGKANIRRSVRH